MLQSGNIPRQLLELSIYLHQIIGITISPSEWGGVGSLPMYLVERYAFFCFDLLSNPSLIMIKRDKAAIPPSAIRKHMSQVQLKWNGSIIYFAEYMSSYERKRLIELKVPFVVPGNQLYLPASGIDLRERFRKAHSAISTLSPATQVVIQYVLYNHAYQPFIASELARQLGYSRMTMSRAFDELAAADIVTVLTNGRERIFTFRKKGEELWAQVRALLRSPVKKRLWGRINDNSKIGVIAGLSALSLYSDLSEPTVPVIALSQGEWKSAMQQSITAYDSPDEVPGMYEIEIWRYQPQCFAEKNVADKISLYLSLQHHADERIQEALNDMMKSIVW